MIQRTQQGNFGNDKDKYCQSTRPGGCNPLACNFQALFRTVETLPHVRSCVAPRYTGRHRDRGFVVVPWRTSSYPAHEAGELQG